MVDVDDEIQQLQKMAFLLTLPVVPPSGGFRLHAEQLIDLPKVCLSEVYL